MNVTREGSVEASAGVLSGEDLVEALAEQIARAADEEGPVSVAVVDLDEFDKLNKKYGTEAGDEVLKLTISHLSDLARKSQAVFRKAVFRRGGDEFVLILPGMEKEDAFLMLEWERAAFEGDHTVTVAGKTQTVPLTFSAAVATYPEDGTRPQDVLRKAFDALYRAKTTGRNKVCLAKEERMVTKTSHYTQPQLARLAQLAKREGVGEAVLLREALDELLRRYGV